MFQTSRCFSAENLSVGWILQVLQPHPHLVHIKSNCDYLVYYLFIHTLNLPESVFFSAVVIYWLSGPAGGAGSIRPAEVCSESPSGRPAVPALPPPAGLFAVQQPAVSAPSVTLQRGVQVCSTALIMDQCEARHDLAPGHKILLYTKDKKQ